MKKLFKYGFELELKVPLASANWLATNLVPSGTIASDASITHTELQYALEIRSSVGSKTKIMETADRIGELCKTAKATVNTSCGYHLHVSNHSFFVKKNINRIVFLWCAIEDVLISTQPESRYNNRYCRRKLRDLLNYYESDIPTAKVQLINYLGGIDRYCNLNLKSLRQHGTIEIRLHAGTVDPVKIKMWIELISAFFTYALTKYNHKEVLEIFNTNISDEKIDQVFKILNLKREVREHFKARIAKFGFTRLTREQEIAKEFMKALPSYKKMQREYKNLGRKYENESNKLAEIREKFEGRSNQNNEYGWNASPSVIPFDIVRDRTIAEDQTW